MRAARAYAPRSRWRRDRGRRGRWSARADGARAVTPSTLPGHVPPTRRSSPRRWRCGRGRGRADRDAEAEAEAGLPPRSADGAPVPVRPRARDLAPRRAVGLERQEPLRVGARRPAGDLRRGGAPEGPRPTPGGGAGGHRPAHASATPSPRASSPGPRTSATPSCSASTWLDRGEAAPSRTSWPT